MPYLPVGSPLPEPTADDAEFWEACKRREFRFQRCAACRAWRFPPMPLCRECTSPEFNWELVPGRGRVFTYTVVHHIVEPALAGRGPYNVVVVELDGVEGVRMISNLVDVEEDELEIGMPVELVWESVEDMVLPRFRRAD